jgi:hypothetical protein
LILAEEIMIEYAIFPFGQVERGSRCVIYGAGRAGQNFFRQVKGAGYCSIEYMVDRNWENIDVHGTVVRPMEALLDTFGYDCCVISILDPVIRQSIVDDIISLGIPQGKIVIPQNNEFCWFWYGFSSAKNEYEYAQSFENYFRCCDAREFVSSKRIDICIRYLLFKDFLNGLDNSAHLSLYSRYVLARTGGKDIAWFHSSDSPKNCVSDYVANGKKLVQSIAERGFKKESYVPVNNFNEPLDGLHRITAAIVSDEPIWVRKYPNSEQIHFDFLFFDKAGFNTEDKIRTLRAFADIYPGECTTAVLFAPVADMWLFIERQLAKSFTIVGSVDYDFCGNYVAFDNIVHEMYDDAAYCNSRIDRKIAVLKMSPLTMRVVLLSDEGFGGGGG